MKKLIIILDGLGLFVFANKPFWCLVKLRLLWVEVELPRVEPVLLGGTRFALGGTRTPSG